MLQSGRKIKICQEGTKTQRITKRLYLLNPLRGSGLVAFLPWVLPVVINIKSFSGFCRQSHECGSILITPYEVRGQ
jgi:hypothetical protein